MRVVIVRVDVIPVKQRGVKIIVQIRVPVLVGIVYHKIAIRVMVLRLLSLGCMFVTQNVKRILFNVLQVYGTPKIANANNVHKKIQVGGKYRAHISLVRECMEI